MDLSPSPLLQPRRPRRSSKQATSFDARRQSLAIAQNFDLAMAGGRTQHADMGMGDVGWHAPGLPDKGC